MMTIDRFKKLRRFIRVSIVGFIGITVIVHFVIHCPRIEADDLSIHSVPIDGPEINESSGLAFSNLDPSCVWTHNDSGDRARLFSIDHSTGKTVGSCELSSVNAIDFESMTSVAPSEKDGSSGQLIVADCGDNLNSRSHITFYEFDEPSPRQETVLDDNAVREYRVRFPDGPRDCEAIWYDAASSSLVLLAKTVAPWAGVYEVPMRSLRSSREGDVIPCKRIATVAVPLVTGADRDGRTGDVWVSTYWQAFCFSRQGDEDLAVQLARVPQAFAMPRWKQIEGIAVDNESQPWVTSEGSPGMLGRVLTNHKEP